MLSVAKLLDNAVKSHVLERRIDDQARLSGVQSSVSGPVESACVRCDEDPHILHLKVVSIIDMLYVHILFHAAASWWPELLSTMIPGIPRLSWRAIAISLRLGWITEVI